MCHVSPIHAAKNVDQAHVNYASVYAARKRVAEDAQGQTIVLCKIVANADCQFGATSHG